MTVVGPAPLQPTTEQAAAAHASPRAAHLIAAGPGTGKTFTMVERFRWLVEEQGVRPEEILAVTFTDAAAGELRERLERELDRPLDETWIGTFHAICSRLLQEHAYQVGMPRETRVLDDVGQRLLLERLRADLRSGAEAGLTRDFDTLAPDEVADLVRAGPTFALGLKGRGIGPEEFLERALERHAATWGERVEEAPARAEREAIEVLHTVYVAYRDRLHAAGRMDFDDLILQVSDALRRVPAFREAAVRRFAHILVDEFQDTNRIQLELIRLLAAPEFANVTAVGDAKQSIYGWRDAEIENIRTRFPGERLPLTLNRRSPQEVLDLATDFVRRDEDFRDELDLHAARGDGGLCVSVVMAPEAATEAQRVADEIERLVRSGRSYSEIAILTSSVRKLPAAFEDELRRHGIPYVTTAGSGFFDREEVKDVLALLRLVADPMDDGALVRVLQGPVVRLGDDVLYQLAVRRLGTLQREGRERREEGDDDDPHPSIRREPGMRLRDCVERSRAEGWPEVPPAAVRRLEHVLGVLDQLGETRDAMTVGDLLNHVLEDSGYLRHCQLRARREGPRALRNLRKVFAMATRFERDQGLAGIIDFVTHLDEVMDAAVPVGEAEQEEADAVRLLTVHAAKGLEFPVVFLVNLSRPRTRDTEKLFFEPESFGFLMKWWRGRVHPRYEEHGPGTHSVTQSLQERRRVVYVALTRAQDLLYVSATRTEEHPEDVDVELDDHFAEILQWALARPDAARVIQADQLELPGAVEALAARDGGQPPDLVDRVVERLRALPSPAGPQRAKPPPGPTRLSFTQLHQFELCPVRYRFQEEWGVPAPPDELLSAPARRGAGASELGSAVHRALAAWHISGGDLLRLYDGPEKGGDLLRAYLEHPVAAAPTLGVEVEFNLLLTPEDGGPDVRVKGLVDRICEVDGRTTLVDYKTNAQLDQRLREAYAGQLQLYGLAAARGLLPGGTDVRLVLFDLRRTEAHEVPAGAEGAERRVVEAARRIAAGDFGLRPEHAQRPCTLCAYRPLCPDRRA